jgi:hypothetical protein
MPKISQKKWKALSVALIQLLTLFKPKSISPTANY